MATVSLPSVCDASFSPYLNSTEQTFILKLAELTRNPSPTINGPLESPSHYQISLGRKKTDGEISVFGAERYFHGGIDNDTPRIAEKVVVKQHQRDESPNLQFVKPKIKHRTPSICSKLSWNSQSALLPSVLKDQSLHKQNRLQGKKFFAIFGSNFSCSDKKSIDVNNKSNVNYGKEMITKEPTKIDHGPIDLVGTGINQKQFKEDMFLEFGKLRFSVVGEEEEEKLRKSLGIFGSPIGDLRLNQERELNMLTWDAIPEIKNTPAFFGSGGYAKHELDIESDASSDLFEIESLTENAHRCLIRQESYGMSSCVTPTCYEPSEGSIDWSVVTARAAKFSTVLDHEERGSVSSALTSDDMILTTTTMTKTRTTSTSRKERRPIMLSGCRSNKALKVANDAYKMLEKRNPNAKSKIGER
ncbi:hypothetical protein NE237_020400 [Protea cynaroides]|uniref:Uncharacterized protein n=1 Tax=Protea cynaroides TaxID=273540 RepID=A0A9Q0H9C2_9MAGN|nr:hypothetical protein NE237_020400 [Protea cynaroides]